MRSSGPLLLTCVSAEHDLALLPHFLAHYRDLGIAPGSMRPILNAAEPDAPGLDEARAILARFGVSPSEIWIAPYTSDTMWARRRELQAREARPTDWVISADVDELHEYPEPLGAFLNRCEALGVDCVQGVFIDRLGPKGRLSAVATEPPLMQQFPIEADVIWSLGGRGGAHDRTGTVKLMAMRGHVMPNRGGHYPMPDVPVHHLYRHHLGGFPGIERPAFRFTVPTRVHHFHWTENLPARLRRRLATPGVSVAGKEYGQKQLAHLEAHGGIDLARVACRRPGPQPEWHARLARLRAEGRLRASVEALGKRLLASIRPPARQGKV